MNLIIDLVEQPTGTISMGGGYGTISGFSIFTELGENNLNGSGIPSPMSRRVATPGCGQLPLRAAAMSWA